MIGTGLPRGTQRRALGKLLELRDRQPRPSLPALALVVVAVVTVSVAAALAVSLAMPTVYGARADLLARCPVGWQRTMTSTASSRRR
jgi:hypothetical protein